MKIAIVTGKFPSLSETFVLDHITGLIDRGHDVHIYATSPKEVAKVHADISNYDLLARTTYRNSPGFAMPKNRALRLLMSTSLVARGMLKNAPATLNCIKVVGHKRTAASLELLYVAAPFIKDKARYDIVHCHFPENGELAVSLREVGVIEGPIVTSFHGYNQSDFLSGTIWQLYGDLAQKGDLFLLCSDHMKRWYDEHGFGGRRTLVHRYPVRLDLFPARQAGINRDEIRLLSIGRFVEKKGFNYAIAAVGEVARRYPNVRYDIVGDGGQRPCLESLIHKFGMERNIRLLGWKNREEILKLYAQTHIFLAPSVTSEDGDQEGIPLVVHEAMASALPVISTWHTGIPELVRDGETGFLVPERDPQGIAAKLNDLLEHPQLRDEMGKRARVHIASNSIEKQTDRLLQIYSTLSEKSGILENVCSSA